MASNIQLENLQAVLTNVLEKKIFLYVNNPAEEPTYITIQELLNTVDTNFDLSNSLLKLTQAIEKTDLLDDQVKSLQEGIQGITDRLNNLNTDTEALQGDVEYLKEKVQEMETTVNAHTSQITSLQEQVSDAKSELSNLQGTIDDLKGQIESSGSASRDYFNLLSWKKL